MKITLTEHAIQQGYKRLHVSSDELYILCNNSILKGKTKENVRSNLRNKVKRVIQNTIKNGCQSPFIRIYDKKIFVFEHRANKRYTEYTLITFFNIDMPNNLYYSMIKR